METLTEKRETWFPIRVGYGSERSVARSLSEQGCACWIPACPADGGRTTAWVRSLLFVRTADGSCPEPTATLRFAPLRDRTTALPRKIDGSAMRRMIDSFADRQSLEELFAAADRAASPSAPDNKPTRP